MFKKKKRHGRKKHRRRSSARKSGSGINAIEQFVVEEIEIGGVPERLATGPKAKKPSPKRFPALKLTASWIGLWLLLFLASLFARTLWPVDATRVLAVAWEMWNSNALLVPFLNGDVYPHPPLMYWLIHLGWSVFGVNEWWPRLVPAAFFLFSLHVTARLARRLWPDSLDVSRYAPLVLLGMLFWAFYLTLALPDALLVFFSLLGLWAVLVMYRTHRRAWLLLGLALGLGMLASGLMILLYVLPVTLLAPLWIKEAPRPNWKHWYRDVSKAVLLGSVILASWLTPAMIKAGAPFASKLLADSIPGPTLGLFPSMPQWWGYLFLLPIVLLPWSVMPLLWMRLWHIRRQPVNAGMVFCMLWALPAIALLSLLDVKQPQWLLPILPAGALVVSYLFMDEALREHGLHKALAGMTLPIIVFGGALAILPELPRAAFLPDLLWDISPLVGIGIVAVGIALAWVPLRETRDRVRDIVVVGVLLVVFAILGVGSQFNNLYQVHGAAQYIADAQDRDHSIAHVGDYQGQFQFPGRLQKSLHVINLTEVQQWTAHYPDGLLITYSNEWQPPVTGAFKPAFESPYGDQILRVWEAGAVLASIP